MPIIAKVLGDAQILAEFANLEPEGAKHFRNKHNGFAPEAWWDHRFIVRNTHPVERDGVVVEEPRSSVIERDGKLVEVQLQPETFWQWRETRDYVRNWWDRKQYKDDVMHLVRMVNSVFDPNRSEMQEIFESMIREDDNEQLDESVEITDPDGRKITRRSDLRDTYIPMQGAIVYLFQHSWRARFCLECGKRFVASYPKNYYCREACSEEATRKRHYEWAKHNGWGRKKQREKLKKKNKRAR